MLVERITLKTPDDWHLHVRDGLALDQVVADTAARFARAIIMPNLTPPVTTVDMAAAYRRRILSAVPEQFQFDPLMTLYLTDNTDPIEVHKAVAHPDVYAFKLYPAGATTNSDFGVTQLEKIYPALEQMERCALPLLVHGEVVDPAVDIFDREAVFVEKLLAPLCQRFPSLRVVLEHITTAQGVEFVRDHGVHVAGTITAHHLLINRNALFQGGIRPHYYCLPVAKRERHRLALLAAATDARGSFFLGTDSAPHPRDAKESACGCAGIYTSHAGIELYAEAFEQAGALDKLEAFASLNGPAYYGLEPNTSTITLERRSWQAPSILPFGEHELVPFRADEAVNWQLVARS
jgi:dihydroorotase